jgi:hypothetical protein
MVAAVELFVVTLAKQHVYDRKSVLVARSGSQLPSYFLRRKRGKDPIWQVHPEAVQALKN